MDEHKIQKFQTVIAGLLENADQKLARNPQKETKNEENVLETTASKEKENLLEIIDYFANILVKHFYNEPEVNISLKESKFSVDQLWFFLQCVIEEKRLNRLNEFFSNLEKQLQKEQKKKKKENNSKDLNEDNQNQTGTLNQTELEKNGFTNTGDEMNLKNITPNSELKQAKKETKEKVKKDAKTEVKKKELKDEKKKAKQDDPFFSYEEMENFVKEAEHKFYKEQEDNPTDDDEQEDENEENEEFMDLNEFECNFENEKDLTYNDFFEDIEEGKTGEIEKNKEEEEEEEEEDVYEEKESQQQDETEEEENENENEYEEEEEEKKEENVNEKMDTEEEDEEEEEEEEEEEDEDEEEEDVRGNEIDTGEIWDQEEGRAAGIERALEQESKHNRQSRKKQEIQIENAIKEINEFDDTYLNDDDYDDGDNETSESANGEIHDKEKIEKELIKKKHWSLTGEVFGYERPKDSILALNVDIPKVGIFDNNDAVIKSIGKFEEDEEISDDDNEYQGNENDIGNGKGGKGNKKQRNQLSMLTEEIELVVKQRIKNMLFDDVERKRIEDLDALTNNENKDEVNFDNLNFSKSKLSLAEEYAKKYENEIKNSQSKNKEMNLQKLEMMNLFKKIMNACDSLSNDYFIPKPVLLNTSDCKVATLNIEEAVPIILAQGNKKTPEELAVKKPLQDPKEMNKRERKALRKLKKEKRKRNLLNAYKEGGGINALKERNEYLNEKNKKEKEEKSNIMKYGTASKEDLSASKSKRRFDFNAEMKKAINYDIKKMEKRSKIE